jgi:hypothetical protein
MFITYFSMMKSFPLPLALTVLLLTGCSSDQGSQRIAAFASATSTTTTGATAAFNTVEDTYYQQQLTRAENDFDANGGIKPGSFHKFFRPEDLALRLDVLAGIKKYADSLTSITGTGQLDQYDTDTKALFSKLSTLDQDSVKSHILSSTAVSDSDIQIFTTAVNALGRWYIEWRREKGVKEVIDDMSPQVSKICLILSKEVGTNPKLHNGEGGGPCLRYEVWKDYSDMITLQNNFILGNHLDPEVKRSEIDKLANLYKEQDAADRTLYQVSVSLTALAKANDQLKDAFAEKAPSLDQAISDVQAEASRISTYYSGLK